MSRVCLLIPDIATIKHIAEHVKTNGIPEGHIHVLGRSSLALDHLHLHQANLLQTTNLPKALFRGSIFGAVVGTFFGVILYSFSPLGLSIPGSGVFIFTLVGLILGLWISGLVGIGVQNPIVEQVSLSIQEGKYLMMIDLSKAEEENVMVDILQHFPQAKITTETYH